jgi:hypothetical protein
VSLRAEENLHATIFTIRLVEQFVYETGRWPDSWVELEQMEFPSESPSPLNDWGPYRDDQDWPGRSPRLQQCVVVDFDADIERIINQDPMEFDSIQPNGPGYEYRDYEYVPSLQETLRKSAVDGSPHVEQLD